MVGGNQLEGRAESRTSQLGVINSFGYSLVLYNFWGFPHQKEEAGEADGSEVQVDPMGTTSHQHLCVEIFLLFCGAQRLRLSSSHPRGNSGLHSGQCFSIFDWTLKRLYLRSKGNTLWGGHSGPH
jgi:hypothetical protein